MVEGGARIAQSFLLEGLVDRLVLYTSSNQLGADGVAAPVTVHSLPTGFVSHRTALYGVDHFEEFVRA